MSSGNKTSAQAQQKFTNLRKRLDQLGYRQTLGLESLPLVEKLFADLVHTTESLKNTKLQLGKTEVESKDVDSAIEPYKSDNAKLVKENNDLHQQIIKQKDESDAIVRELKASLRKLEHENADLIFLNNQYVHKVKQLEKESREKSDRILNLQEKNFHAVVQTPGGKKKSIPFRRQRMEIDCAVPPSEGPMKNAFIAADDPYVADLLQVADSKIAELEKKVNMVCDEKEVLDRKLKSFKQQVANRDEEIERLNRMLEGGRPSDVVALEARNRANERMISHLNIQIDFLQQKTRELERKYQDCNAIKEEQEVSLSKSKITIRDQEARIQELELDLRDVDRMAKRLETDKNQVVRTADREMMEAKDELEKSRHELEDLDLTIAQYKAENQRTNKEISEVKAQLSVKNGDLLRLEELLDRVQEDKKRLSNRCNKMMTNEKELVLEIERLKRKNGPATTVNGKKPKSATKLDAFIRSIEEERNYYKDQTEALQKMLRGEIPTRSRSPIRSRPSSRSSSPVRDAANKSDKKTVAQYETIIRVMEEERDYYKKEYEVLKAVRKSSSSARATPTKNFTSDDPELSKVIRERDDLKALLDKFERHMAEIQANVKVLTAERDKLNIMYEETKDELQRVRRELVKSPKSPKTSLAAQAILRRVETERDDALQDLRRMTTERDSLRERLKIATETSLSDRAKLEQKIEDLDSALHHAEVEKNEMSLRIATLREDVRSYEDQVKEQALRLGQAQDNQAQSRSTAEQMKLIAEETEKSLEDSQKRLSHRERELHNQEERGLALEEKCGELKRALEIAKDDISQLRATINAMDREKDSLQHTVDEKTEKIAHLNEDILHKEKMLSDLKIRVSELEAQLEHANDNLSLKDRELKSMRRQLDSTSEDLSESSRSKDIALRENRRLQDDLSVMTRENQKLNSELQETLEEREQLKHQVQDYIMEVKRIEDVLARKENERTDLLDQYRALSAEAEQYQTSTHQLESEGSNLRLELMTKDSELRRARDKLDNLEREIQEHLNAEQAYELQVSNLTRSVGNLEEAMRQTEEDKQNLLEDLTAVRELCAKLEATKESIQRQLTSTSLDKEQLSSLIDDMKQETELLRQQLGSERSNSKNLEGLLQNNREKEFQSQLVQQEKSSEIQMLKDRLALNESKIQSQGREIASLRTRNVELEGDVERLRRNLTSEKFERERAVQELRRHNINPPIPTMEYSSYPGYNRSFTARARSRSRSRSPSPSRYRSPDTSFLSSSARRARSPERSSYLDDPSETSTKGIGQDVL
ncbi:centrosomal protein of 135 kDa-like isoform X1 [Crassostrea angulata]|uniref:centrosomal protein of 135 kDa-like isoform X1 n=2 Tax=Magallana angulata TaxID=2784310 RepID=UPI0022B1160E|nr:centrosomal protein of 135 kDa-like isoform X1 [Crassostrea angulata]